MIINSQNYQALKNSIYIFSTHLWIAGVVNTKAVKTPNFHSSYKVEFTE